MKQGELLRIWEADRKTVLFISLHHPLVTLVFGIGGSSKIILVAVATFTLVLINAMTGVRGVEPVLAEAAKSFGGGRGICSGTSY